MHKTLKQRGIPDNSHFTAHFHDGTSSCETDANWSDLGEQKVCDYFGGKKTVCVCKHKIKQLHVKHGDLEKIVDVPDDCEVYQAIRAETTFFPNQEKRERILGRVVGLVKNGKVIEEYFLNGIAHEVVGMRSK